ncbi:nitroreductase family protein [Cohnella cholangitidis]|uniref:nitroreductase family protein n=1 Tax=Cohnella cholangitidis TaxID=2598458 RepID=UPI002D2193C2|nr:nitroreductase family protein [Cohnella cholangitidis]
MASLEEIIQGRRSIGKVKDDPVPRELIEKLLEAATWAPSHHATEPWKFVVMTGGGRRVLGQAYADIAEDTMQDLAGEDRKQRLEKEVAKAFRAPS